MALSRIGLTGEGRVTGSSIRTVSGGTSNRNGGTPLTLPVGGQIASDNGNPDTEGTIDDGEVAGNGGGQATTTTTSTSSTPIEKALSVNDRMLQAIQDANANKQAGIDPSMFQKDPMADMLPMLLAGRQQQPQSSPQSSAPRSQESQRSGSADSTFKDFASKMQADQQKFQQSMFAEMKKIAGTKGTDPQQTVADAKKTLEGTTTGVSTTQKTPAVAEAKPAEPTAPSSSTKPAETEQASLGISDYIGQAKDWLTETFFPEEEEAPESLASTATEPEIPETSPEDDVG